jgi:hypothetical protein
MGNTKLPRAPLIPVMMITRCPACETDVELEEHDWGEDISGAYVPHADAQFPVCSTCGTQFEVAAIQVSEVPNA